jgi:hypothetical protein
MRRTAQFMVGFSLPPLTGMIPGRPRVRLLRDTYKGVNGFDSGR